MAFKMRGHELPGPNQRKSPATHTQTKDSKLPGDERKGDTSATHNAKHASGRLTKDHVTVSKKNAFRVKTADSPATHTFSAKESKGQSLLLKHNKKHREASADTPRSSHYWKGDATTEKKESPAKAKLSAVTVSGEKTKSEREKFEAMKKAPGSPGDRLTSNYGGTWTKVGTTYRNEQGLSAKQVAQARSRKAKADKTTYVAANTTKSPAKDIKPIVRGSGTYAEERSKKAAARKHNALHKSKYADKSPAKCPLLALAGPIMGMLGKKKESPANHMFGDKVF